MGTLACSVGRARGIALLLSILIGVIACQAPDFSKLAQPFGTCPEPVLSQERAIERSGAGVFEAWRTENLRITYSDIPAATVSIRGMVIVVSCVENQGLGFSLTAIDSQTGNLQWQSAKYSSVRSVAADGPIVVTLADRHVRRLSTENGQELWTSDQLPGHTRYRIHPDVRQTTAVYWTDDGGGEWTQNVTYYRSSDGQPIEEHRLAAEANTLLVLRSPSIDFWTSPSTIIFATEAHSGRRLWEVEGEGGLQLWPWRVEDLVAFSSGLFPELQSRSAVSGQVVWAHSEPLVSNVVLQNDTLFAIQQDATLVAIDATTGQSRALIEMAHSHTETRTRSVGYWVAATDGAVFAYYGDSQELIAFHLGPD